MRLVKQGRFGSFVLDVVESCRIESMGRMDDGIARITGVALAVVAAGCAGTSATALRADVEELRALHEEEQIKLEAIRAKIAMAQVRAERARREAGLAQCRATVESIEADVAALRADCAQRVAAFNLCQAENSARQAKGGIWGCILGIGGAVLSGGAAAPWALSGCGVGLVAGAASTDTCPTPVCIAEGDILREVLRDEGLDHLPMCGGMLGVRARPRIVESGGGREIVEVGPPGTTAAGIGLQAEDILLSIGDHRTMTTTNVDEALEGLRDGDAIEVDFVRDGQRLHVQGVARQMDFYGRPSRDVELGVKSREARDARYAHGMELIELTSGSPAEEAGLAPGNVILAVDDQPVATEESLRAALTLIQAGQAVELLVQGAEERRRLRVVLGDRGDDETI
ncbi:MAG: PDZ domain-containing protein [Myxococcota bacterium]